MVWALVLVVVIGVGLPVTAWAVSHKLPPPRPGNRLGVGYDRVDKWLLNRYQLPPRDRWRVREAVSRGDGVNDPGLARAAHELAADLLANRFLPVRFWRLLSWFMLLAAGALASGGIVMLATPSHGVGEGVVALIDSAVAGLAGTLARRNSRHVRHNLTKALQLNEDGPALDN